MNRPIVITGATPEEAYGGALHSLVDSHWDSWNLVVQIQDPGGVDADRKAEIEGFARRERLLRPHTVATTLFPSALRPICQSREDLYAKYVARYLPRYGGGWGTYFGRMIAYPTTDSVVNQLEGIIASVVRSKRTHRAAYTLPIQLPGRETRRARGGPCLNYIAFQLERDDARVHVNMLAVYRNHDFLRRAYGNYRGLGQLLVFVAEECELDVGCLTCVSSHAYIDAKKPAVRSLVEALD